MKARRIRGRIFFILIAMAVSAGLAGVGIAANWYDGVDDTVGTVAVTELADWMIQGRADFATLYIAKELNKVKQMNNLICIVEDSFLEKELAKLPKYKKWIVITPDGKVSQATVNMLGKSAGNGVFLLDGGKNAWEEKITAPSIDYLDLQKQERMALNDVRPFFQNSSNKASSSRRAVVKPAAASIQESAEEEEEEEEEEEGC